MYPYEDDDAPQGPSKTKLKAEMHELQDLGMELSKLPDSVLSRIPMDERLHAAILEYRRLKTHEARRRHSQFVGKLLRDIDTTPLRRTLEQRDLQQMKLQRDSEEWLERILEGDAAVTEWIDEFPHIEVQPFRTMVRNARKEWKTLTAGEPESIPPLTKRRAGKVLWQDIRSHLQKRINKQDAS